MAVKVPTITKVTPNHAEHGTVVVIAGTEFDAVQTVGVKFGGNVAEFTVVDSKTIKATVPSSVNGAVDVQVENKLAAEVAKSALNEASIFTVDVSPAAGTSDWVCSNTRCGAKLSQVVNAEVTNAVNPTCVCGRILRPTRNPPVYSSYSQRTNIGGGQSFPSPLVSEKL